MSTHMIPALFWDFTQRGMGSFTIPDNPSVPSSSVKQSRKNAGATYVFSCVGNDMGCEWFSENVTLANSVSGAWRNRKRGRKSSCLGVP